MRRPSRRPHNPPRLFPTFRQTIRIQPPRRRKPHCPNVPPMLPQRVKHAQLAPRFPAINQLNPRRYGPIAITDQMLRTLRAQLPGPVNHFGPRPKSPQRRPRSITDYLGTPYAIDAAERLDERFKEHRMRCLKPIAQKLRTDSIIATYATATVASVIAWRVANRNRAEAAERARGDDDTA